MAMLIEGSLFEMLEAEPVAPVACPTCDSSPLDLASIVYPTTCIADGCSSKIKDLKDYKKHVRNAMRTASASAKHAFLKEPLGIGSRAPKLDANGNLKPSTASMRRFRAKVKLEKAAASARQTDSLPLACESQPEITGTWPTWT